MKWTNQFNANGQYHPANGSFLICNRILTLIFFLFFFFMLHACLYYNLAIIMHWLYSNVVEIIIGTKTSMRSESEHNIWRWLTGKKRILRKWNMDKLITHILITVCKKKAQIWYLMSRVRIYSDLFEKLRMCTFSLRCILTHCNRIEPLST